MIAVDTNILVYAHREEFEEHARASSWLQALARSGIPWGVPSFALGEFVRVTTHPNILAPPSPLEVVLDVLERLAAAPGLRVLGAGPGYPGRLVEAVRTGRAVGNLAFDAQIAAVCKEHGVGRLLTRDRDFSRFPWIDIVDLDDDPATYV